jgi:hypothetical protein
MKKLGLILVAALIGATAVSAPSSARSRGPGVRGGYQQGVFIHREPNPSIDSIYSAPFSGNS